MPGIIRSDRPWTRSRAILAILVAIAILFEIARRIGVPYPTLFVLGGLGLAFVPGLPRIELEPDLVLLVFLPPLLFSAAVETPIRDLRANLAPIAPALVRARAVHDGHRRGRRPGRRSRASAGRPRSRSARSSRPTDALAATTRLPPPRRAARRRDPHRGRGAVQRRDRAGRLPGGRRSRSSAARSSSPTRSAASSSRPSAASPSASLVGRVAGEILRRLDDPPVEVVDLARHPVRRLPAGRPARPVGRARGGHRGPRHRQPAGHDPHARAAGCCG